ncbi:MAG: helix-turn-helix transcriptional regulator [Methanobrevibacter sp.]|nr:helix-turn-helix transcriptional regulator [Methanobrevibacter sp.]
MRKPDRINYEFDLVLGQTLKEKRMKKNLSLEQVAKKMNITRQAIFRYEKAEVSMKNSTFQKYCYAIDEKPSDVYEEISLKYMRYVDSHKEEIMKKE